MTTVRILISSKEGVFDPEGKVVQSGLERLGYAGVARVRVGKVIELELDATGDELADQVASMCSAFLVNPVIEDYSFEVVEA